MVTEQYKCIEQQVIKVHGIRLTAALLIALVNLACHWNLLELIVLVDIGVLYIGRCSHKTVLGIRYAALDYVCLICLVIQLHLPDDGLDQVLAVSLVIDGEVGAVADLIGLRPEDTAEYAVEGAHPEVTGAVLTHSCSYSLLHLTCRLVGKGKGKYGPRINALLKQMGYLVREHSCFSGTGTGYDH